jgi:hypothetical protein
MFELTQAAAHGLPMVATKNGGPVDIHRVKDGLHLFHILMDQKNKKLARSN